MFISLTDTNDGVLSKISGMEPVFIQFEDNEGNTFAKNFMVYDIQARMIQDGKSKGTLVCCSPDLINNAATKVSRRFGAGGGKTIDKIVKEDILEEILTTTRDIDARPTKNTFSFISAYWSPFTMINYLASKSIPKEDKDSRMLVLVMLSMRMLMDIVSVHTIVFVRTNSNTNALLVMKNLQRKT